jgi:Na+/H+-dicarboxylate symporter
MGNKDRGFILTGLVAALFAAGFVGWMWGSSMKKGVDANTELLSVRTEYRNLAYSLSAGDEKASSKLFELNSRLSAAEAAYEKYAFWYSLYRLTNFSGKLFLNLLNLLVIPLIIASIVLGMVALGGIRHVGRTGMRTVIYYFLTTSVSVLIGIVLVQTIEPGAGVEGPTVVAQKVQGMEDMGLLDTVLGLFVDEEDKALGAFPGNITGAMARMNVLGVIVFSLFFGAALSSVGERGHVVVSFFDGVNEVVLKLIHWVLYLLPLGVFGLVVGRLAEIGGGGALWTELSRLAFYALTVISGLALHGLVVLPLVLFILAGRNPASYASGMVQALLTALSTASSSATLPTTMECAVKNNKVSQRSASFVLPLGATINMDGTALYEAVAVIFIAQVYGVSMDATMLVVVFLTATFAAVGAAGIPEAGLVTMVIVLNATGLPLEGIAILLSIDWLLDRFRTTINVWGDAVGAAVIDRFEEAEVAGER